MEAETIQKNGVNMNKNFFGRAHKMKKTCFFTLILIMAIFSCKSQENKYIYLNAEQLKPLGIELSEDGLFYQNCNPKWEKDEKYPYYSFYSVDKEHYVNSSVAGNCPLNDYPRNEHDSIFMNKKMTENDFYPLFVGTEGKYTFLSEKHDKKLVPIAIRMTETKIPNRTDTVIFWFKVTESLKKSLPEGIVIEDYLGLPDITIE
jgi:hypothetical protein